MIVKRITNPKKSTSKSTRIRGLIEYILGISNKQSNQVKCDYNGARGFFTTHWSSQAAEMLALSLESARSKDPISHYILSWKRGEIPRNEQIDDAVGTFLKVLGLEIHQTIYAVHRDTHNRHLHIVVNRVHPLSMKPIEINGGFDVEAAHQAIAWIEHMQGWRSEKRSRYFVDATGVLCISSAKTRGIDQPGSSQREMEIRTGKKSAQRTALEVSSTIFWQAKSWSELHQKLADVGISYEKVGGGAVLYVGGVGVKASRCGPAAKFDDLQGRLGKYEVSIHMDRVRELDSRPSRLNSTHWTQYAEARAAHRLERAARRKSLQELHQLQLRRLCETQKSYCEGVFASRNWKGAGDAKAAMRIVLTEENERERERLKSIQKVERKVKREEFAIWPTFEQWRANAATNERLLSIAAEPLQPQFRDEQLTPVRNEYVDSQGDDGAEDGPVNEHQFPREK